MSSPAENILTEWPPELLVHLNETTRACQFDWKAVAERVSDFVSRSRSLSVPVPAAEITPALCRELFAACNTLRIPAKRVVEPAEQEREREADLSSLSLDELIAHVERSERRIERRKEEVFQRVLHSLGGVADPAGDHSDSNAHSATDEATQAYIERQREKQRLREQQEEKAREARERERLEAEREKLKRRFDPDSADAEGENPLSLTHSHGHSHHAVDRERHAHHREEKDPSEYSLSEEALSLEQVLGGAEFDLLLSELERELDAQAADKDDNEELSELGAILDFLDQEATVASKKNKNKNKSSNNAVPSSPPHRSAGSLSAALPPTPVRQDIAAAARDLQTILGLFPPLPPHIQREREEEEDEERAQAKTSSLALLSRTTIISSDNTGTESVTVDAATSLTVSLSATETEREKPSTTTTTTSAVRERNTREPVRDKPQSTVRDMSESESDEDDDAAWRRKRAATKHATASLVSQPHHTTRAAHTAPTAPAEKLGGVWGAHTAPTVSQSLSHAILQRQREAEEEILEIARLAAELQQQRSRVSESDSDSESESEESEDESEKKVSVENDSSAEEEEEEEEETEDDVNGEADVSDERENNTQKESETVVVAVSEISSHTDTQTPVHIPEESASSGKSVALSGSFGGGRRGAKGKTNTLSVSSRSQKSLSATIVTQTPIETLPDNTRAVTETLTSSLTQAKEDVNQDSSVDMSVSVNVSAASTYQNVSTEHALTTPTSAESEGENTEGAGNDDKETERDIHSILSERLSLSQCGAGAHTALSLLPVRSFSDKHTGTVIACAPSQNTTRDVSLHTLLTISLYTDRLYKRVCGGVGSEGESERDFVTHTPHTEVPAMRVIEFVLRSLFVEDWELLGLWQNHAVSSVTEGAVWRVVFSAQSHAAQNTLSSAFWREQWKEISLTQLLASSSSTDNDVLLSLVQDEIASNLLDFIEISDYFNEAEKIEGVLRESSLCVSTHALAPSLTEFLSQNEEHNDNESAGSVDPLSERLVQSVSLRSVACLCLQDYLFTERDVLPERLLSELVRDAETRGLRLVGCRLTHVPPSHSVQTHMTSHTGHSSHTHNSESGIALRRTSAEAMASQSLSLSQSLLPTLTLAFAAHSLPTPSSHISGTQKHLSHASSSSHSKHTLTHTAAHADTNTNTSSAGDVLRALLGPEDPLLAKQTDPQSVRARYGTSRERSVAYTPSYARERQTREVAYWFAPPLSSETAEARLQQIEKENSNSVTSHSDVAQPLSVLYTLSWPCERVVSFTVTLSRSLSVCVSPTMAVSRTLHKLQQALFDGLLSQFLSVADLCECHTLSQAQFTQIQRALSAARLRTHTVSVAESSEDAQTNGESASQRLFLSFHTHVSDLALARFWEEFTRRITEESRKCVSYSVDVAMYGSTVSEAVFLSQALYRRAVCCTAVTTGSRLAVFDAQRVVTREDTRSHEDLGLCDVVVLRVSVLEVQHVSLLLGLFPPTCAVHILGVKTLYMNDTNTKTPSHKPRQDVEIVLRGYQLLENVEYCLTQLSAALTGSSTQQSPTRVSSVSVLKGTSALEKVFSEFSPSVLYTELAVQDLADYVPSTTYTLTQQAPPQTVMHMPAPTQTLSKTLSVSDVARALFPPSAFNAVSLLFLPWQPHTYSQGHAARTSHTAPSHDARYMRVLSRTLRRLEREGFLVLCVQSVALTHSDCLALSKENSLAFATQPSLSEVHLSDGDVSSDSSSSSASVPATVLLLLRNAATLRLKTLCGPVTDTALAAAHYPRSLTALLTDLSLASSTQQRDGADVVVWPALLPSLTCALTEKLLHRYLPQCVEVCARLQRLPVSVCGGEEHSEHDTSFVTAEEITHVITEQWPTDNVFSQRISLAATKKSALPYQLRAKKECEADNLLLKTTNIAALVLTRELLRERGLSAVLEALQREGLWITNVATAKLDFHTAKLLLEAAGASSLTMRPRRERLLEGPVLCLGVCGPVHAFVRLKAFTVDAHSPQSLWMLDKKDSDGNVECGVLASSSSSLARELYCLCFDKVLGEDSPFEIVSL